MHPNAIAILRQRTREALESCSISEIGWPYLGPIHDRLRGIANELLKHKSQWISAIDVSLIFHERVHRFVNRIGTKSDEQLRELTTVLLPTQLDQLEQDVLTFFASIPRSYDFLIALPKVPLPASTVHLTDTCCVRVFEGVEEIPEMLRPAFGLTRALLGPGTELEIGRPYLAIRTQGYCRGSLDNVAALLAYSGFKLLLQQCLSNGLLDSNDLAKAFLQPESIHAAHMVCLDSNGDDIGPHVIPMPFDFSGFLKELGFRSYVDWLSLRDDLIRYLRPAAELFSATSADASRVRAAAEWWLDSCTTENQTVAFLQVCIGLEAIYGSGNVQEKLTQALADRCSYFLGTSVSERGRLRKGFIALYQARSKIVHGNMPRLSAEDLKHLRWGKTILQRSISKELEQIGTDSES